MWAKADRHLIDQQPSEENGWELTDDCYKPIWFEGEQLPQSLVPEDEDNVEQEEEDLQVDSSDEDEDSSDED